MAKSDVPPALTTYQEHHSRRTTLDNFFGDLISEKEVSDFIV
jgi:hypothetical protein